MWIINLPSSKVAQSRYSERSELGVSCKCLVCCTHWCPEPVKVLKLSVCCFSAWKCQMVLQAVVAGAHASAGAESHICVVRMKYKYLPDVLFCKRRLMKAFCQCSGAIATCPRLCKNVAECFRKLSCPYRSYVVCPWLVSASVCTGWFLTVSVVGWPHRTGEEPFFRPLWWLNCTEMLLIKRSL